jgi:hypothetical protein
VPGNRRQSHTIKAERMAEHIEESAKKEGRYKGREEAVAWATVHKDLPKAGHKTSSTRPAPSRSRSTSRRKS